MFPDDHFIWGPYPKDVLSYKSDTVVEYKTPASTEELGTGSALHPNGSSIRGVAVLVGQEPSLLLLSVRLPANLTGLTSEIIGQIERDAARRQFR